jgi:mRNA-degrading endonuclease RelE of RelBE toxin-antitoxin system
MGHRSGPHSQVISRAPRSVSVLMRAERDLVLLRKEEREEVIARIDALEDEALPRGVQAMQPEGHLRVRVGAFRVLYKVVDKELFVVAVTREG